MNPRERSTEAPSVSYESNLAVSDQLFFSAIESMPTGTALVSPEGRVLYANPALCAMLGRNLETMRASSLAELLHPDDATAFLEAMSALAGGGRASYRARERLLRADGSTLWGDLSASCVRGADGSATLCVIQVVDVTAEQDSNRVVQAELQDWARLTRMLDSLLDPHVLLAAVRDEEFKIVDFVYADANEAACKLEGCSRDALLGTRLLERHPAAAGELLATYSSVVETGKPLVLNGRLFADQLGDGQQRRYDIRGSRCRDGLALTWRDVTDRDQAMAALADTEEQERLRLAATLDSMLDPHVLLEAVRADDGRAVDFVITDATAAACESTGRSRTELIGSRLLASQLSPGAGELIGYYAEVVETGRPLELDDWRPADLPPESDEPYFDIRAVPLGEGIALTWRNVTRRHTAARALADSEAHFRLLAENSSDVVAHLDWDSTVRWISPSLAATLGWSPAEWTGTGVLGYVHPEDLTAASAACERALLGEAIVQRCRLRGPDDTYHWVEAHAKGYQAADGGDRGLVLSFRTVDTEVAYEAELRRVARYDGLTGLLTRKQMLERVQGLMHGHPRTGEHSAVLFCDVDRLDSARNQHGATVGDEVLRVVAGRIGTAIRDSDVLGRAGTDEFLVVLTGVHDMSNALEVAERIRYTVCDITSTSIGALTPSVSIGASLISQNDDVDALLKRADAALTEAKQNGRDQVVVVPDAGEGPGGQR